MEVATAIRIPDIGTTVDEIRLVRWLKKVGDPVKRGESLCEVETDKAVSELESIAQGVLLKIVAAEDTKVEQGTVVAYVGVAGELISPEEKRAPSVAPAAATATPVPDKETGGNIPPLIRNLAKKEGVDLSTVTGSGPGGRITREDVLNAKKKGVAAAPSPASADRGRPLSANQSVVSKRVARSQREIPPIDLTARFDMTRLIEKRAVLKKEETKISFDAFFVQAVARVMKDFPHFRSRLEEDRVIESDAVVTGIAIGVEHDLFTPVIRSADSMALEQIESAIQRMAQKAEKRTFATEDLEGGTLTVSNLGMYPVRFFSAVIPPGQIAILSIGATEQTPVVKDGAVAIVPMANVTLSVDHRLINGREAAEFLTALKKAVEAI